MTNKCLAPICPDGMAEFNIFIEGVWLVCHFEYEPYERATENEPACELLLVLQAAYHHGVDIMPLMQDSIMIEIEDLALIELENQDD
jgi:hypothetical protein